MQYNPARDYYPTNPIAAICDHYDIDWDAIWAQGWHVAYETSLRRTLETRDGKRVLVSLYRMPSGTYEAITYRV